MGTISRWKWRRQRMRGTSRGSPRKCARCCRRAVLWRASTVKKTSMRNSEPRTRVASGASLKMRRRQRTHLRSARKRLPRRWQRRRRRRQRRQQPRRRQLQRQRQQRTLKVTAIMNSMMGQGTTGRVRQNKRLRATRGMQWQEVVTARRERSRRRAKRHRKRTRPQHLSTVHLAAKLQLQDCLRALPLGSSATGLPVSDLAWRLRSRGTMRVLMALGTAERFCLCVSSC
mmetsp:Transcript_21026/g.34725  ORF Transcript_21026/g.34725 Transcript_21026/m.34725 type:complete len:229 (-) Transcript_21026:889-1575(-)